MKLRLQITKDRSIRFISHLEYARTLMRAVLRAKLPVAYSEGFNPHMKLSLRQHWAWAWSVRPSLWKWN